MLYSLVLGVILIIGSRSRVLWLMVLLVLLLGNVCIQRGSSIAKVGLLMLFFLLQEVKSRLHAEVLLLSQSLFLQ